MVLEEINFNLVNTGIKIVRTRTSRTPQRREGQDFLLEALKIEKGGDRMKSRRVLSSRGVPSPQKRLLDKSRPRILENTDNKLERNRLV